MIIRDVVIALASVAVIAGAAACATSTTSTATASSAASTATASSGQPSPAASALSTCANLGGKLDPAQGCHVHAATPTYTLDFRFPVDYPDQQAVTDSLTTTRDDFVSWVGQAFPRSFPYELDVVGKSYHSGPPDSGTQSLVFDIGTDTGVHPVTSYKASNYDLGKHAPITFDTLFKPGSQPLEVLNPAVRRELDKHGAGPLSLNDLGVDAYQNFAITDDAVIFFFNQDGLLTHVDGPLQVDVPRNQLVSLLA